MIDWADIIAERIESDILDRRGLKWEYDKIDEDIKVDIRSAWARIVRDGHKELFNIGAGS